MSSEVCNNLKPRSVAIAFDNAIVEIYKENNRKKDDIWWGLHNLSPVNNHGIYTIAIREVLTTENTGIKYKAGSQYPIMFSGMLDGIVKHT